MQPVRDSIIQCLTDFGKDEGEFISSIKSLVEKEGDIVFPILLNVLTHLDLNVQDAKDNWEMIIYHQSKMGAQLRRPVSLATAICDFFSTVNKTFHHPKLIEIEAFEHTVKSSKRDSLTELYNRGYFEEAMAGELKRAQRYKEEFSFVFFDLDNFKNLNDTLGHQAGDIALKCVASVLIKEKRTEDIAARYGGEELVMILPNTPKLNALVIAERIRKGIEEMVMQFGGNTFQVTVSGGVSSFPGDATGGDGLVNCADMTLYQAKGQGKNRVLPHAPNKRNYIRIDYSQEIVVYNVDQTPTSLKMQGKNVSLSGILFESKTKFELGSSVLFEIPATKEQQALQLSGQVMRIEKLESTYDIGVAFLKIEAGAKGNFQSALAAYFNIPLE